MLPALRPGTVGRHVACIDGREVELTRQRLQHRWRHRQRIVQEGSQVAHGAQLHREAEPVVVAALASDPLQIDVIEVKVPVQLVGRGRARVAAVLLALRLRQKADRHRLRTCPGAAPRCA